MYHHSIGDVSGLMACSKRPRKDTDASEEIHTHQDKIGLLEHHIHEIQSKLQERVSICGKLLEDNKTLTAGMNTTIRALDKQIRELKTKNFKLEKNDNELKTKIVALEKANKRIDDEKCALEKDNNELKEQKCALEKDKQVLIVNARSTTKKMNQLLEANKRIDDENKDLKRSNKQAIDSENTEVLQQTISNYEKEMANLKAANDKVQNQLKDLEVKNSGFKTENAQLREFHNTLTVLGQPCKFCLELEWQLSRQKENAFQYLWELADLLRDADFHTAWDFAARQKRKEVLHNITQGSAFNEPIQESELELQLQLQLKELKETNIDLWHKIHVLNTRNLCLEEQISKYNAGQTDWQLVGNSNNTDVQLPLEQSQNVMQPLGTTDSQAPTPTIPSNFEIEDCTLEDCNLESCTLDDLKGFLDDVQMVTQTDPPPSI